MRSFSVVWPDPAVSVPLVEVDRDALADLAIDRVIAAILRDGDEYGLAPLLHQPVRDPEAVSYRREVFADMADDAVRAAFEEFAAGMRRIRKQLAQADRLIHVYQRGRWRLDAAADYLGVLTRLSERLAPLPITARGLSQWRELLGEHVGGVEFTELRDRVGRVRDDLGAVRYSIRITGRTIEVGADEGSADYSATIANLFARFGSGTSRSTLRETGPQWADMNATEERILDHVAELYPDVFARLDEFCRRYPEFIDPEVARFDREIQFYLVYLAFARRIATLGHRLHLPVTRTPGADLRATDAFDLALATRLRHGNTLICNDIQLSGPECVLVVTGPNQGGKTTFARTFGQLVYFAALGCPVPAREARLPLPDAIFTHFEHAEDPGDPDGRLLTELTRMRDTLDRATADSLIVMNESFSSTSSSDAVRIGTDILDQIVELGALALWVTFFDELADNGPAVVSMVATTESPYPTPSGTDEAITSVTFQAGSASTTAPSPPGPPHETVPDTPNSGGQSAPPTTVHEKSEETIGIAPCDTAPGTPAESASGPAVSKESGQTVADLSSEARMTVSGVPGAAASNELVRRTFRIERRAADGQAYALELAERYGLGYERVVARIGR